MKTKLRRLAPMLVPAMLVAVPVPASAWQVIGSDAEACAAGGPALLVDVTGLRDRSGRLKLELYPATTDDYLKDDNKLIAEGKTFRRVWATPPASGPVQICIKVPRAGRYGLFFTHDRDGKNKFNIWQDGGGVPSNRRIGSSKPKLEMGVVEAGSGVTQIHIQAQYLRSVFTGFGPLKDSK